MTSDDTLNKYIRDVVRLIIPDTSYLIIKADQSVARPSNSYCTVKVLNTKSTSWEEFSQKDINTTDTELTTKVAKVILVSFNFFRHDLDEFDPFYLANLVRQALNRETIKDKLNSNGLGLATRSSVKNLTFQLDSGFEERAGFNATFNFVDTDSEVITTIGTVQISGDYENGSHNEHIEIDINN